ncbi:MAG: hypothetical protein HFI86_05280 [Bacilli bacterium]|nr:hypothetical protein [Bacilli bacterium]MCI9434661.1 hypothetical protein [Bacilli bacterium]
MKESFWGILVVGVGIVMIFFIYLFQSLTNTEEHNYTLLKETTEAAMYDAFDLSTYHTTGEIRIDAEKFIENFYRRFAENANLSRTYKIDIVDINEEPPKVSVRVSSSLNTNITNEVISFDLSNTLDAILETPY